MSDFMGLKRLSAIFSSTVSSSTGSLSTVFLASSPLKKSICLLSALLIIACQPSSPTSDVTAENSEAFDTKLLIRADSITMTPDHILSIKPTRYQPSLGLEGDIEPIKQVNLITAQALTVEQVLVKKNQRVEKGAPLFTVRRQTAPMESIESSEQDDNEALTPLEVEGEVVDNKSTAPEPKPSAVNTAQAAPKDSTAKNSDNIKPNAEKNGEDDKENSASASSNDLDNNQASKHTETANNLITVRASFAGRIEKLYVKKGQQVAPRQPLLTLSDGTELHFIASLPIEAKSQISVGQTVNFTADGLIDKFTGQVSKLTVTDLPKQLLVYVNVVDNEVSRNQIKPGMKVTGRVDYGQIEVGTIVPKRALHNVDLTVLHKPPYKPLRPLSANVWIIKQNQRLTRQPVEVIEYDPLTKQYLIAGITNDSLICLANLPDESEGKKAVVS